MKFSVIVLFLTCFLLHSCSQKTESTTDTSSKKLTHNQSIVGLIEGKIFCVPSPYKFAQHIRKLEISYNPTLLNDVSNRNLYQNTFRKSVNLGIYGVNLAYINTFQQATDAVQYFSVINSLSADLGLSDVFDIKTLERLENNIGNKDSILIILTNKYQEADMRLKKENQQGVAALILTGSWIESLYLLTQIEKEKPHPQTREHIAEHMFSASGILELLKPLYNTGDNYTWIIDAIVDLCYEFDGITYDYTYAKPITYPDLKRTVFTSQSSIDIKPEQLKNISEKIEDLRNAIIR